VLYTIDFNNQTEKWFHWCRDKIFSKHRIFGIITNINFCVVNHISHCFFLSTFFNIFNEKKFLFPNLIFINQRDFSLLTLDYPQFERKPNLPSWHKKTCRWILKIFVHKLLLEYRKKVQQWNLENEAKNTVSKNVSGCINAKYMNFWFFK